MQNQEKIYWVSNQQVANSGIDIIKDKNSAYKFFDAKRNDVRELMAYSKGEKIEKKGKKNND